MTPIHVLFAAVVGALVAACASRDVPHSYPKSSAASPEAAAASQAVVTRALMGDPPLPGEPTQGWEGLSPEQPADAPPQHDEHAGHRQHQHGSSQPEKPEPPQPPVEGGAHHEH